jgi:hypothetical protein
VPGPYFPHVRWRSDDQQIWMPDGVVNLRPRERFGGMCGVGSLTGSWDSARRLREPVTWTLLVLTALGLLIGAWQLFGMPGTPPINVPAPVPGPVPAATFGLRAAVVAPQFVVGGIFVLPIVSVVLVAFAGGLTDRARQVVQTAISIQAVTLGLGLLRWLGALGAHVRPGAAVAGAPVADAAVPGLPGRRRGLRGRRRLRYQSSGRRVPRDHPHPGSSDTRPGH